MISKHIATAVVLLTLLSAGQASGAVSETGQYELAVTYADNFLRTELYFGRSIPGGGSVSDIDWETFLAEVVTPRFPDGFTIIDATGQYREKDGKIDKEASKVLIFLYPNSRRTSSRRKIEEIRRAYVSQFKQESVLRLDFPGTVSVSF